MHIRDACVVIGAATDSHLGAANTSLVCFCKARESRAVNRRSFAGHYVRAGSQQCARRRYNERWIVNTGLSSAPDLRCTLKGPITSSMYGKEKPMQLPDVSFVAMPWLQSVSLSLFLYGTGIN